MHNPQRTRVGKIRLTRRSGWWFAWLMMGIVFSADKLAASPHPCPPIGDTYLKVRFYSTDIILPVIPNMAFPLPTEINETVFRKAYAHFESCEYHPFLKKVGDYRRGMNLGDWHFYCVVADYSEQAFAKEGRNMQVLFQWFVLRKSGIDARLFHSATDVFLNVRTEDIEFGFYMIEQGGHRYANLTARRGGLKLNDLTARMPLIVPDSAVMSFSMSLPLLPRLTTADTIERLVEFQHKDVTYRIAVRLNKACLQMMDEYPFCNQRSYFQMGMSREAENSLLPALQKLMVEKSDVEKVALLLSFTRTAFFYRDDEGRYGKEKPMTPEETLYHSYSDCEDRSALFFYLCRKLIGLPEIVIDFDNHVGCAVALQGVSGDFFEYRDIKFMYCEPTGPQDVLKPGEMWDKVRSQNARILVEYIPE